FRPNPGAGRAVAFRSDARDTGLSRCSHHIRLPNGRTVADPEGRDAASKRATWVLWIERASLFPRSGWYEYHALFGGRGSRQACGFVRFDTALPMEFACMRIQCIKPSNPIAVQQCCV